MKKNVPIHHPKTMGEFRKLHEDLTRRGFIAFDALKPRTVKETSLASGGDAVARDEAKVLSAGQWSNGPLLHVAWSFDDKTNLPKEVEDADGNKLGLGYVQWGSGDNIPSTIPVLALALPYTAAPLRYLADLTAGLGPRLMYRFHDGSMCEYRDAGERLLKKREALKEEAPQDTFINNDGEELPLRNVMDKDSESSALKRAQDAYSAWERTWNGYDVKDPDGTTTHIPGAKEFLRDNNLNLHISQCEQDDVMLDIYFPTVGLQRGRRGLWNNPKIVRVDMLPSHSCRLERMNEYRHINHVYFSDRWRTQGRIGTSTDDKQAGVTMYPAAMPQHLLSDLKYIVESNRRSRIKDRPVWIVCPTYYPSGQKPYYPQPAWWSVFTAKAFDFSSTILYDKAKQRENKTSWGKIFYISLDYLNMVFADRGIQGDVEAQQKYMDELEANIEDFLQHRENNGKMMRQFMFTDASGKEHHNVEITDVADTSNDEAAAGKNELELSTSPIFLALQVDPRLVGVPMVAASNGGTALREMHLLKQQQLNVKQRLYLNFLNTVARFNEWDEHAEFVIMQQTLTTLDNSKTGTVDTISGEKA